MTIVEKVTKEIESVDRPIYWDNREGLGDYAKDQILKKGLSDWFNELEEYNYDTIAEITDQIREEIVNDHIDELQEHFGSEYDINDLVQEFCGVYPAVYIDPKDVLSGETIRMRLEYVRDFDGTDSVLLPYVEFDSYVSDIVDALNLCPQSLKQTLLQYDIPTRGTWRTKKNRHGKELVEYSDVVDALLETRYGGSILTIPVVVDLYDLWQFTDYDEVQIRKIRIEKGATFGFFASFNGSGSPFNSKTIRPVTIDLETSYWRLVPDSSYSIKETYGVYDSFYNEIGIIE